MQKISNIFSRRPNAPVDFKPDTAPSSPSAQARRLSALLASDQPHLIDTDEAITDCPDALDAMREYQYRKIFTGTSHEEFLALDETDPQHIDWAIRVHEISSETFSKSRNTK